MVLNHSAYLEQLDQQL